MARVTGLPKNIPSKFACALPSHGTAGCHTEVMLFGFSRREVHRRRVLQTILRTFALKPLPRTIHRANQPYSRTAPGFEQETSCAS